MLITVINAGNYLQKHVAKLRSALNHFRFAVNSVQFRNEVLNHTAFETSSNLSNLQIYSLIMAGQELNSNANGTADLNLTMDHNHSSEVIGYTIDTRIFTFRNMFESLPAIVLAGHYAHEYCHTLGFKDPDDLTHKDNNVPYEIGRIVTQLTIDNAININLA